MTTRALITGITGQDGAYLAQFLLNRGYEVHGTSRHVHPGNVGNLRLLGILDRVSLHVVDTAHYQDMCEILEVVRPAEVFHLASQSSVGLSFEDPAGTVLPAIQGTINLLEAIRRSHPAIRFYHSASSEMFGGGLDRPCSENDLIHPRSPYAVGKAAAHWAVVVYRETYGLYACSGIVFNHESPIRDERFVTRKITATVAQIKAGLAGELRLGNLAIQRDWGYAPEYVEAMWLMLQQDTADDYVIATGTAHSLQEFVETAFAEADLDWQKYTVTDARLFRRNEVLRSVGDPSKANRRLGWAASLGFTELVRLMVRHDVGLLQPEKAVS